MYKFLANIGDKVRVVTTSERKKKQKTGRIVGITENLIVVRYKKGYRESFNVADIVTPVGAKLLVQNNGKEWSEIEHESVKESEDM